MDPRPNSTALMEILETNGELNDAVIALINWMSDDDVGDFMIKNGYCYEYEGEEAEEEYDKSCILEYWYNKSEKLYEINVKDETNEVIYRECATCIEDTLTKIETLKKSFDIIRVIKI